MTQNEDLQKFKIRVVLETANRLLGIPSNWTNIKWTVEGIHSKQLVQLIHFLVALIRHYRAPIRLPQNVTVNLVVVQVSAVSALTPAAQAVALTASLLASFRSARDVCCREPSQSN